MSSAAPLVAFDLSAIEPEEGAPPADRIVKGAPTTRTWTVDVAEGGRTLAGVWEATPGAWRVAYDEWEFCAIVSGVSILHADGEEVPRVVREGDAFVLHPGFRGIWEVVETTRKHFVVRLPDGP